MRANLQSEQECELLMRESRQLGLGPGLHLSATVPAHLFTKSHASDLRTLSSSSLKEKAGPYPTPLSASALSPSPSRPLPPLRSCPS